MNAYFLQESNKNFLSLYFIISMSNFINFQDCANNYTLYKLFLIFQIIFINIHMFHYL